MIVTQFLCDCCKKEVENINKLINYSIPIWQDLHGGLGNPIILPKFRTGIEDRWLCSECSNKYKIIISTVTTLLANQYDDMCKERK